jgi:CheY-like chemotaxis protein
VAQDGAEALDYLFGQIASAAWDPAYLPEVVLLDLKLPKVDGMEVLHKSAPMPEPNFCRW